MLHIHKPGQGYWTRLLSALGFGAIVAAGAMWVFGELETLDLPSDYHFTVETEPEGLSPGSVATLYMDDDGDEIGGTAPVKDVFPEPEADGWVVVAGDLSRAAGANDASTSTVRSLGPQVAQAGSGVAYEITARQSVERVNKEAVKGGAAIGVIVVGAIAILYLCYANRKTVEFLIATEGEMKKVNWSSRREVLGSTWVVIGVSVAIAVVLLGADVLFSEFFGAIGVLER